MQNFGSIIERLECRRNIVSALSYLGHSQPEIARILHVDIGTIDRDLRYLRQQSKENIGKKVEHYHVAVSSDIPGLKSSIEFNLTKEEVEDKIVKRYNDFEEFECEERKLHPAYVTQLLIYKTMEEIKDLKPAKEPAVTNSEKWNNIVLQHGTLVNKQLDVKKYDLVQLEKFKIAKKYMITNSVDTMNDFSKVMITLVSAFFCSILCIDKILRFRKCYSYSCWSIVLYVIPPICFIISIICLVIGAKPLIIEETYNTIFNNLEKNIRQKKYNHLLRGVVSFVIGLGVTTYLTYLSIELPTHS